MTPTMLICQVPGCGRDVERSWFDRGPLRRWVHQDDQGRPVAAGHRPDPGPRPEHTGPVTPVTYADLGVDTTGPMP